MRIRKDVLQKLIDEGGSYLLVNRYIEGLGAAQGKDEWQALIISPNIPREYWDKKIGELPFDLVEKLAETDSRTCIHLGKTYSPFQYGIYYKDFIQVEKLDCPIMELILRCYKEDIKDFHKALEIAKDLTVTS